MKDEAKPESKPYTEFAEIYDRIMSGVDYEAWADYIEQLLEVYGKNPRSLVDLACGTGNSTLPFARRGYRIAGVDISAAMLEVARRKVGRDGYQAGFYEQDLCTLELPDQYDLALLFQDGLNYILSERQLALALAQIFKALNPGGLFIFDLTRPRLRCGQENSGPCLVDQEDLTLILESGYNGKEDLWSSRLTVFQRVENGLFRKFEEKHKEKDHNPDLVVKLLKDTGFVIRGIHPTFGLEPVSGSEQKLTFVTEK